MTDFSIGAAGRVAIGLALIGGLLALTNVFLSYRRSGEVDVGKLALAVGVPALIYAIVKSAGGKRP